MSTPSPPRAPLRCPLFSRLQNIEKARERRTFETMAGSSETGVPDDLLAHSEVTTLTLCPRYGGGGGVMMIPEAFLPPGIPLLCPPFFVEPLAGSSEAGVPDDLLAHSEVTTLTLCPRDGGVMIIPEAFSFRPRRSFSCSPLLLSKPWRARRRQGSPTATFSRTPS